MPKKYFFLGIKLFCFSRSKAETCSICLKWDFVKPQNFSTHSDNCYFHIFYQLSDWVEILWGFTKFFFKKFLKVSAFYLEKQNFSSCCKYQNNNALFTDPIFREGFDRNGIRNHVPRGPRMFCIPRGMEISISLLTAISTYDSYIPSIWSKLSFFAIFFNMWKNYSISEFCKYQGGKI